MTNPPPIHPTHAFHVLANLHPTEYDLLATEINNYAYAIRTRTGRTTFTAQEARVLFNRMMDIMVLKPEATANEPQDLDQMKKHENAIDESAPKQLPRRV
jgi:hypothetical protein